MDDLNSLVEAFDKIDVKYGNTGRERSDPMWAKRVAEKDQLADKMYRLVQKVPDSFPSTTYLISQSYGRQTVALQRIRYTRDPLKLDLVCYMLLNSPSNFLQTRIMYTLAEILRNCDYRQLIQCQQTLLEYFPPSNTCRSRTKSQLLELDVESKFFNSFSGIEQFRISKLFVIRNHRLFKQFEDYRSELGKRWQLRLVYHGSSRECLRAIAENGFLEPKKLKKMTDSDLKSHNSKVLDKGYFGCGIYQGFSADYAIYYAERYKQSDEIILSAVLSGRSYSEESWRKNRPNL
ncbi:unnamed protein product [Rotaria magnacalcarata]|uniref:PARP n=1 Tax=Rotaria magnacalcarata TaxID=392030 RepID=A0A816NPP1_9BILA|nr:unnamed protein product [Rotaria magnacalcarata]CAF3842056.1 unnamed protein product [Rotaria magnacalcarata]